MDSLFVIMAMVNGLFVGLQLLFKNDRGAAFNATAMVFCLLVAILRTVGAPT